MENKNLKEMDIQELTVKEKQLKDEKFYYLSLYTSYEAKLSRVDPLSDEFEETFKGLAQVSEKLEQITIDLVKITSSIICMK